MDEPYLEPAILAADAPPLSGEIVKAALDWDGGFAGLAG